MDSDRALGLMSDLMWHGAWIAGPILLVALLVGLLVSVLQVATQLQEATLSYVPKLVACALAMVLLGPWLIGLLTNYAIAMISMIPQLG